jgi:hypothetical protein
VKTGRTTAEFCDCSLGWTQAAFSTVLGKPVTVEIEESVLRDPHPRKMKSGLPELQAPLRRFSSPATRASSPLRFLPFCGPDSRPFQPA